MIINSRQPRIVEELTVDQVYEALIVCTFKKPMEVLRAEVRAAEEQDLAETVYTGEIWE